jgi:hypothetical protein
MTDAKIAEMETAFGPDLITKAFEGPLNQLAEAQRQVTEATEKRESFETFYHDEVLPKVSTVYQDAINMRTQNAALTERLKAAKEYGFLSDEAASGIVPGTPPGNPIPGSPAAPGAPASGAPDSRYVSASDFTRQVTEIPAMLGRLTKMSNEHFSLFGAPLLDVDELIGEAQRRKVNVQQVWSEKYKVEDKRKEITSAASAAHDRQVAEEAVRKYASDHGQPFTRPGVVSTASRFVSKSTDDVRQPWKGSRERKEARRGALLEAYNKGGAQVQ